MMTIMYYYDLLLVSGFIGIITYVVIDGIIYAVKK